jgi:hypothetical protein
MSILAYYSRADVQEAMIEMAKNREVVGVFRNGAYGSRPNMLLGPADIIAMVKAGVIEFHCSIERWSNPMALKSGDYDKLRIGWDLIFDIDCANIEHGKAGAHAIVWALRKHGVKDFWIKFTGGNGFHIGLPWETIPKEIDKKNSLILFPSLARQAIIYLKNYCRKKLEKELLKIDSPEKLAQQTGKKLSDILTSDGIDPWKIVTIDPILISTRHLFRMPYSINGKSGLVSIFLQPDEMAEFTKEKAMQEKVKVILPKIPESESETFFTYVMDWAARESKKEVSQKKQIFKRKIGPDTFPPCIQTILQGLAEGRKRSLFILVNFLYSLKWPWPEIENLIYEWNGRNKPPLRESYVRTQLRYSKTRHVSPPSCANPTYYTAFNVCKPNDICKGIKNPIVYPIKLLKSKSLKQH